MRPVLAAVRFLVLAVAFGEIAGGRFVTSAVYAPSMPTVYRSARFARPASLPAPHFPVRRTAITGGETGKRFVFGRSHLTMLAVSTAAGATAGSDRGPPELTGVQRRQLRAEANRRAADKSLRYVSVASVQRSAEDVQRQLAEAELVQCDFAVEKKNEAKALAGELAALTGSAVAEVFGHSALLYRPSEKQLIPLDGNSQSQLEMDSETPQPASEAKVDAKTPPASEAVEVFTKIDEKISPASEASEAVEEKLTACGGVVKKLLRAAPDASRPAYGAMVSVLYTGRLLNGSVFDDSHADSPNELQLHTGMIVDGLERGIRSMRPGERATFRCAPKFAFGPLGLGSRVPPDSTVVFDVELLSWREGPLPENDGMDMDTYKHALRGRKARSGRTKSYRWTEDGEEMILWLPLRDERARDISCDFRPRELSVRVGEEVRVAGTLRGRASPEDSYWVIDEDDGRALQVVLAKSNAFSRWDGVLIDEDGEVEEAEFPEHESYDSLPDEMKSEMVSQMKTRAKFNESSVSNAGSSNDSSAPSDQTQ